MSRCVSGMTLQRPASRQEFYLKTSGGAAEREAVPWLLYSARVAQDIVLGPGWDVSGMCGLPGS